MIFIQTEYKWVNLDKVDYVDVDSRTDITIHFSNPARPLNLKGDQALQFLDLLHKLQQTAAAPLVRGERFYECEAEGS